MKLAYVACALGRHRVDLTKVRTIHGMQVGRCRHCRTPMEEMMPFVWQTQQVHDAGLGRRFLG